MSDCNVCGKPYAEHGGMNATCPIKQREKLCADLHVWADAADEGDRISYAYANGAPCPDVVSQMGADIRRAIADVELVAELQRALVEAKRALWLGARDTWTLEDFKRWAVIEQIDAALTKSRAEVQAHG